MKNPSRGKKMFFLFLATILIMVLIWKTDHPVAEYVKTGVRLSDLSEQECVDFVVSKGVEMPLYYEQSPYFAGVTKEMITYYEENPYSLRSGTLGSPTQANYFEDIRRIVNEYYGIYNVEYLPKYDV